MPGRRKKSDSQRQKENKERSRRLREIEEYRAQERERDTSAHQVARENDEYRTREQERNTAAHQLARENISYRRSERLRDRAAHQFARENEDYRVREQQRNTSAHQRAREDESFRTPERQRDQAAHQSLRENEDYRVREQQRNTSAHQRAREDESFRTPERQRDQAAHQSLRENEDYRVREQQRNTSAHQRAREDESFRTPERQRDQATHQSLRENEDYRVREQQRNTSAHQRAREDESFRTPERQRDQAAHQSLRENEDYRVREQQRNTSAHQRAREDESFRTPERQRDQSAHQLARENVEYRGRELERDTTAHRVARENEHFRTPEKNRDRVAHQAVRASREYRQVEQDRDTETHRTRRQDPNKRTLEFNRMAEQKKKRIKSIPYEELLDSYNKEIRQQPSITCPCCGRLLYKNQTAVLKLESLFSKDFEDDFLENVLNIELTGLPVVSTKVSFCHTCKLNITKGVVPRLSICNGFKFPEIPPELQNLSTLEERLVALRIPFMQIRLLGFEQQSQLRGNVVNVENDLDVTAEVIPRRFDETSTVQVQLMRRMRYRRPYLHETIRPYVVQQAARYLTQTELYQSRNVQLSDRWSNHAFGPSVDFICSEEDLDSTRNDDSNTIQDNEEQEAEEVIGADETLIHNETDYDLINGTRIAPGEGKTPVSLFTDLEAEELSFPSIYAGKKRTFKEGVRVSYTDIAKWEIMNVNRVACKPTKVLYSFKKSFNEKVSQCVTTFLRKKRGNQSNYKASQVRNSEFLRSIVEKDEGYSVFKNLRSSPSYWAAKCKKAIAMVRQLGKCHFFITLSAAERKWNELLVTLMKVLKNKDITEEEAQALTDEEKNELIRADPVTCMRHFDRRFHALFKLLFKADNGLFSPSKIVDFFIRLEFQMRGSPHLHGLYWLLDAPEFIEGNEESIRAVIKFIDKYITCARVMEGELSLYVKYQIHKHSHTCRKGMSDRLNCRFNYPKPPLPETMILQPLPKLTSNKARKKYKELYSRIQEDLNERGRNSLDNPTFSDYISSLEMTKQDYIMAIRSSIKRTTVFNKREVNEAFVNPYNTQLLLAWKANIDIQYVLDTYACAKYCVGYVMKSDGGMSKLMRQVNVEAATGNVEICSKLNRFAKMLWNGTEISAQEAAGFLLGIKNVNSSRADVYIDTSPPEERTQILKSKSDLETLDDDDENVYQKGLLDHYINRPIYFEDTCLAEFAANFEYSKTERKSKKQTHDDEDLEANEDEETNGDEEQFETENTSVSHKLVDGSGFMRKRKGLCKIIRFRHYMQKQDAWNFWREQLMLYVPWRNEEEELLNVDPIQKAKNFEATIIDNCKSYHHNQDFDDETLRNIVDEITDDEEDDTDCGNDDFEGHREDQEVLADIMMNPESSKPPGNKAESFLPPKFIEEAKYLEIMRSLNDKQRRFVLHLLHHIKTSKEPLYNFLSGGAGVGKSHVITAIVQSMLRFYGAIPDRDQSKSPVIVSAFTGKAAFNVFGMTLHHTFNLPATQRKGDLFTDINDGKLGSIRQRLMGVKLFIIDEISMVSLKILEWIDRRLRQIYASNAAFGGRSVLVVGHLRQLPPIAGQFVFENARGRCAFPNPLWPLFKMFELEEIMRQQGEIRMCKALNNMSEGAMDEEDISLMETCRITETRQPPPNAIWLFPTNKECAAYNQKVHDLLETEGYMSTATDRIEGKSSKEKREKLLDEAKNLIQQQCDGLRYQTYLQVNAQYFISTNIDVQDGLFNGATGTIKHIEVRRPEEPTTSKAPYRISVIRVWMLFESPLIGIDKRKSYASTHRHLPSNVLATWTPIEKLTKPLSKFYGPGLKLVRTQIPLVACNGMTIAKSQGSSLPAVVVSLRGKSLRTPELYVACSRATSLTGLFIDGDFIPPLPPDANDLVGPEMIRLRANPLALELKFLQDSDVDFQKLYVHNIQSVKKHVLDLISDPCAMAANFIGLLEPQLLSTDELHIPNYHILHRVNCSSRRNSEGIVLLGKDPSVNVISCTTNVFGENHCVLLTFCTGSATVVLIYKKPQYSETRFMELVEDRLKETDGAPFVFAGDFNVDLMKPENRRLIQLFQKYGFRSQLESTICSTNGGTQIDCCFANIDTESWLYESYYGYHKPICIKLKL